MTAAPTPATATPTAPPTAPSAAEIHETFSRPLAPIPVTPGYRLRLSGVLAGLLFLQCSYLLLVALVLGLTGFYGFAATGVMTNAIGMLLWFCPVAAGLIATVFLMKPLVKRGPRPPEPFRIRPDEEPILFDFIHNLCDALGAPHPSRVYVDLQINASASLRGWRGFFSGELDLTLGLPLARSFTLAQFTGVLAHEFGHFSQRTGLRSWFLTRRIELWFARVVYQRDSWDAWLERMRRRRDYRIKAVAHTAAFAVKWSRRYLELLMKAGNRISCAFSRQMEYDADRHEAAIVGPEVFESTVRDLLLLNAGSRNAWQDSDKEWSMGRLPDDMPALIAAHAVWLPPDFAAQIVAHDAGLKTGPRDTHPCNEDRIRSVRAWDVPWVFHLSGPASALFRELPELCRRATLHHYGNVLGERGRTAARVAAGEASSGAWATRDYERAAVEVLGAPPDFCARWFRLPACDDDAEITAPSRDFAAPEYDAAGWADLFETNRLQFAAMVILGCGVKVRPEGFRVRASDLETVRGQERASSAGLREMEDGFRALASRSSRRFRMMASRLDSGSLSILVPDNWPQPLPNVADAWQCYAAIAGFQETLLDIRRHLACAATVRENAKLFPAAMCANTLDDLENYGLTRIEEILAAVADTPSVILFDPSAAATLGGQLKITADSRTEKIGVFVSRAETIAARALSELCWVTSRTCDPAPAPQTGD